MSAAVDTNVLLYASDPTSPFQSRASELLHRLAAGPDLFCLAWPTVMGYLRISTHLGIFSNPLSPEQAMGNVDSLLRLPHVRMLSEGDGFWDIYREVAAGVPTRGNLVSDAHVAALLREHGVRTICTGDSDFRRFGFLEVLDPFA